MPLTKAKKQVLLADDNEEYAKLTAQQLMRAHSFIECQLAHSIEETLRQLRTHVFDVILIDRGLPFKRGDYRQNAEDALPLAQSIKLKGDAPQLCDGILKGNRKAYVIISTGIKGGLRQHLEGIDALYEKGKQTPETHILLGLKKYEKTPEDEWDAARPTMSPLEHFLHNELVFSKHSPVANKWQHAHSLYEHYWDMLQKVRDRANPRNPYKSFLSAAQKRFNSKITSHGVD
jgi:CheY-like chemotaxis protein